jgi:hypothetical protein
LPASKSALISNFVSQVGTSLGPLACSFDFADMGIEFIAKMEYERQKIDIELV